MPSEKVRRRHKRHRRKKSIEGNQISFHAAYGETDEKSAMPAFCGLTILAGLALLMLTFASDASNAGVNSSTFGSIGFLSGSVLLGVGVLMLFRPQE